MINDLSKWRKYKKHLCESCKANCCKLPVEVSASDLIRLGLTDEYEVEDGLKKLAKRLTKEGIVQHFNLKEEKYIVTQMSNDDCLFLDSKKRKCTVYDKRPETCRNHPDIGPRPGYCPYEEIN